jgi:hypothetical protein
MPDPSEFEEKEYEFPLYRELVGASLSLWTPGQVLEGNLGFDAALSVANTFWSMVDRPVVPGVELARYGLSPMDPRLGRGTIAARDELPDFSLNLFLQVKRPHVYREPPQTLIDNGLNAPVWFFQVTPHQQVLLETLANHLGAGADVSYAAAAFTTKRELFALSREQKLVAKSSFPPAATLSGHERWAYDAGGAQGVGYSDPAPLRSPSLIERITKLAAHHPPARPRWTPERKTSLPEESVGRGERDFEQIALEIAGRGDALVPQLQPISDALSACLQGLPDEQRPLVVTIEAQLKVFDDDLPLYSRLVARISTVLAHFDIAWLTVGPAERAG